jgi:predicted nucleotidyltransferase
MSKNEIINRNAIIKIANALGELNNQVVFVGGAMVSLYADDPIAEDVRATKDIDLTFQIATASELEALRQALIDRGFYESTDSDVICRFNYEDLLVDVMSTKPVGWAPGNRWFALGFAFASTIYLENVMSTTTTIT